MDLINYALSKKIAKLTGAEAAGTADGKVSAHNTAGDAHNDIRELISGLTQRLNAKVNVSDIIDNLTTNVANKPLSAAQGVALKALIDEMNVPASTTADNGKVLSVVDGAPSWTITSSEQAAISAANAEQSATIAKECAQAMAGTFDFTGYLRYQVVDTAPETYEEGVLYLVTNS